MTINEGMIQRLHAAIAAVCPIAGVSGVQGNVRIDFAASATAPQRAAAQSALAAFDWSQAAHDAWLTAQARNDAKTWLAGASIEAKAYRALVEAMREQINAIRTRANMVPPSYTRAEIFANIVSRIDSE